MTKELYGYDEEDILTLEYIDGVKEECGIIGIFGFNGKNYIALNPLGTKDVYLYGKGGRYSCLKEKPLKN